MRLPDWLLHPSAPLRITDRKHNGALLAAKHSRKHQRKRHFSLLWQVRQDEDIRLLVEDSLSGVHFDCGASARSPPTFCSASKPPSSHAGTILKPHTRRNGPHVLRIDNDRTSLENENELMNENVA